MQVIQPILILSVTPLLGWIMLYCNYYYQINKLNNPRDTNLENYPTSLRTMIDNFNPEIKLIIVKGSITETRAVTFGFFQAISFYRNDYLKKGNLTL